MLSLQIYDSIDLVLSVEVLTKPDIDREDLQRALDKIRKVYHELEMYRNEESYCFQENLKIPLHSSNPEFEKNHCNQLSSKYNYLKQKFLLKIEKK